MISAGRPGNELCTPQCPDRVVGEADVVEGTAEVIRFHLLQYDINKFAVNYS